MAASARLPLDDARPFPYGAVRCDLAALHLVLAPLRLGRRLDRHRGPIPPESAIQFLKCRRRRRTARRFRRWPARQGRRRILARPDRIGRSTQSKEPATTARIQTLAAFPYASPLAARIIALWRGTG